MQFAASVLVAATHGLLFSFPMIEHVRMADVVEQMVFTYDVICTCRAEAMLQ